MKSFLRSGLKRFSASYAPRTSTLIRFLTKAMCRCLYVFVVGVLTVKIIAQVPNSEFAPFLLDNGNYDAQRADSFLDAEYKRCLARAPKDKREIIRVAQRAWIAYTDKTETALKTLGMSETQIDNLMIRENIVRAAQLRDFYARPVKPLDALQVDNENAENELTAVYHQCISKLSGGNRNDLTLAEKAWIEFKEKNRAANAALNPVGNGVPSTVSIVTDRIWELRAIYLTGHTSNDDPVVTGTEPVNVPSRVNGGIDNASRVTQKGVAGSAWSNLYENLRHGASQGDARCQGVLSLLDEAGICGEPKVESAVTLAQASAKAGNPIGIWVLGQLFANGRGVGKDAQAAFRLNDAAWTHGLSQSANSGDLWAQFISAIGCLKTNRKEEGVEWLHKSALQGNPVAQVLLGNCYIGGVGISKNDYEAIKWFRKAADQGWAEADVNLGVYYLYGLHGIQKDEAAAFRLFSQADNQGLSKAKFMISVCYYLGAGIEKDDTRAAALYNESFGRVMEEAQNELGQDYSITLGSEEEITWCRRAAEMGFSDAQDELGSLLIKRGERADDIEAVKWYEKASDQGCVSAEYNLAQCYTDGAGVQKDVFKARDLLLKAKGSANFYAKNREQIDALLAKLPRPGEVAPSPLAPEDASLKVKGLYIDMDINAVPAQLRERLAATDWKAISTKSGDGNSQLWILDPLGLAGVAMLAQMPIDSQYVEKKLNEANVELSFVDSDAYGRVNKIRLRQKLVDALFKASDMNASDFVDQFVKAYKIPEVKEDGGSWRYTSHDGVKVTIDGEKNILIEKVPTETQRKGAFD